MFSFRTSLSSTCAAATLGWLASAGCPARGDLAPEALEVVARLDLGEADTELKLVKDPHLFLLEIQVNGEGPFLFSVDTGLSARVCVSERLRRELKLPRRRGMLADDGGGRIGYNAGSEVDSISIGDLVWMELPVLVADLNWLQTDSGRPIDGIVGMRFFGEGLIQFDGNADLIRLFPGSLPRMAHPQVARYRLRRGVPYCWMKVGPHNFPALLDTGFDGGIALPDGFRDKVLCYDEPRFTATLRTTHSQNRKIYSARLKQDASLAGFKMHHPPVQFLQGYKTGIIGAQALRQFVVTLDRSQQRVHFALP
ncbi:MAG: clan AA aspartic protease [Planctomycetes bacterium]|nr:clan AA aspartic protease [Planctomycetota bacterium]